jgi:ubiquinone/menaquinone biosynthesis C-methylase UbiE
MKISRSLDNYIRRSSINRYMSYLRKYSPWLYSGIKKIWEKMIPIRSKYGLARYQIRAVDNFIALTKPVLNNSIILEIGSDSDAKILRELVGRGAKRVVGINPGLENEKKGISDFRNAGLPAGCELRNDDATSIGFDDDTFTHIVSVSVLEHLNNFEKCLSEMYRVLKPGGYVYAEFGPIWSSGLGHHVYATVNGEEARHWDPSRNPVPNYAHLLLTKEEMRISLQNKISKSLLEAVVSWIYDQSYINRMFYEDYIRAIEASAFQVVHKAEDREHLSRRTKELLKSRYPDYTRFDVRNAELVLRKS